MTAMIKITKTVMIATVTILFVAILKAIRQLRARMHPHQRLGKYLLAMPFNVLLLRSV